jgi:hypothetical protein
MIFGSRPARRMTPFSILGHGSAGGWPRFLFATLLSALLVQALAVQSHIHAAAQANASAAQVAKSARTVSGDPVTRCALCQEAAMAGAYLLPAVIGLPPAPAAFLWLEPAAPLEFALPDPARGWLSRAPPR